MTVTYSLDVSTSGVTTFLKILFRWRGSVYKAVWKETFAFLCLYFALSSAYKFALSDEARKTFDAVCVVVNKSVAVIPLNLLLGFYVTVVYGRWWSQFLSIPWPESIALKVASLVNGNDERGKMIRRNVVRYCNLSFVLGLRVMSVAVRKRFPTYDHVVESGFMTSKELQIYLSTPTRFPRQWIPCQWACNLLKTARVENRITSDFALMDLVETVNTVRRKVQEIHFYDWISIPLVYTQVVTLAVYSYFAGCLLGRQYLDTPNDSLNAKKHLWFDFYFPFFTILEFLFYVGWLKVAECLINPWGEDDDDFESNFILERNIALCFTYVDFNFDYLPPLEKDRWWQRAEVILPHTAASFGVKDSPAHFEGSVQEMIVTPAEAEIVIPETIEADAGWVAGRLWRRLASVGAESRKASGELHDGVATAQVSPAGSSRASINRRHSRFRTRPVRSSFRRKSSQNSFGPEDNNSTIAAQPHFSPNDLSARLKSVHSNDPNAVVPARRESSPPPPTDHHQLDTISESQMTIDSSDEGEIRIDPNRLQTGEAEGT